MQLTIKGKNCWWIDTTKKSSENVLTNRRQTMRKVHTSAFDTLCLRRVKEDGQLVSLLVL